MTRLPARQEFSAHTKARAFERAEGCCEGCGVKIGVKGWQCDHIVPACEGGTNDISNARALCIPCHKPKSAGETARCAKADRLYRKHIGAGPKKRKMPYRTANGVIHWNGKQAR